MTGASLILVLLVGLSPAKERYLAGEAAFKVGRFEDALKEYTAAYELQPHPDLLFNIAQCHRNLANYDRAIFFLERYLEEAKSIPDRERIEELIYDLEQRRVVESIAKPQEQAGDEPPPEPTIETPKIETRIITTTVSKTETVNVPVYVESPIYERGWFWGILAGAAAVVGGAVAIAVVASKDGVPEGEYEFDLRP
jgi:tetratricopeptide (TPR) repeat protein